MTTRPETCFHCDEPVPSGLGLSVRFDDCDQPVCCHGCEAVASLILASGQADYYRYREQPAAPVDEQMLDRLADWDAFETLPGAAAQDGMQYADVLVEGIRCSACGWLIERQLQQIQGVSEVQVDIVGREVRIGWQASQCSLADPLRQLVRLGYRPHPGSAEGRRDIHREERRQALRRLGVAGLGMMQVMMVAGGTWFASSGNIDPAVHRFLDLVAMLVATPVVIYAGAPFFTGALRALSAGRVNVDVPVALAIGLAFGASCRNLLAESGPVYFESVSMFVFFLLLGRFVEMVVRQRSVSVSDAVARLLPDTALRLDGEKQTPVPRDSLSEGDRVQVRHGEAFAADGEIIEGLTRVDESLLTGESLPLERGPGEQILAGSINLGGPVMIKVGAIGDDLVVSQLQRLLARARGQRPPVARQADRLARYLVAGILLVAVVTWGLWLPHDPEQAFQALLAVLVVTCPCALSLATPSVLAAASVRLSRQGVLVFSSDAITTMADLDRVVLDKTGTLTRGRPTVRVDWLLDGEDEAGLLAVCGSLERGVSHPIANAFRELDGGHEVRDLHIEPGMGLTGNVDGKQMVLGNADLLARCGTPVKSISIAESLIGTVWVARDGELIAALGFDDTLRADAPWTAKQFTQNRIATSILSGDQPDRVASAGRMTGIEDLHPALSPQDKLGLLRAYQRRGEVVLAVGDGVNDAPLLAGANVSAALGSGASLAHCGADLLLPGDNLAPLLAAVSIGRASKRIIRQNLTWALVYNLSAVPLAALGMITPWLAAAGMSASSLLVVLNAARLTREQAGKQPGVATA